MIMITTIIIIIMINAGACAGYRCDRWRHPRKLARLGWHCLSKATCLIRPHLFYACFVVSRLTMICYILRHVWRKPALYKWFPLSGVSSHRSRACHDSVRLGGAHAHRHHRNSDVQTRYGQSSCQDSGFQRVWLKQNLDLLRGGIPRPTGNILEIWVNES